LLCGFSLRARKGKESGHISISAALLHLLRGIKKRRQGDYVGRGPGVQIAQEFFLKKI
jgi:hypothetical protein